MEQAGFYGLHHPQTQDFAAGGFRDMTRIAESEPRPAINTIGFFITIS